MGDKLKAKLLTLSIAGVIGIGGWFMLFKNLDWRVCVGIFLVMWCDNIKNRVEAS